jgi:hypothetical protein
MVRVSQRGWWRSSPLSSTSLWVENPYWLHFCSGEHLHHKAPFDRSSISRWRKRLGKEGLEILPQESVAIADAKLAKRAR